MDYDSPWKEALDVYFKAFLALLFDKIHDAIDWDRPVEVLNAEFQQIAPESETGRRFVDKLVKVWLLDGTEAWIIIHIEVQTSRQANFPRRMVDYRAILRLKYNGDVLSLAVLADDDPTWRPNRYRWKKFGCSEVVRFPTVKLLDFADRIEWLETNPNPFARFVLAHLKTRETHHAPEDRLVWKERIVKGLFDQNFSPEEVRGLFRFIDWIMVLPEDLSPVLRADMDTFQKEKNMPYIPQTFRLIMNEGKQEELIGNIERGLQLRFGEEGAQLAAERRDIGSLDVLHRVLDAVFVSESLEQIRSIWVD